MSNITEEHTMRAHHEEFVAERPSRAPTHPGAILKNTVKPALHLTTEQMATRIGVTRQTLHNVMTGGSVSPEMALRLGKLCGNGPDLWLNMQHKFDLWHAKQRLGQELEKIESAA
jgi:addiction module HigA family antidote